MNGSGSERGNQHVDDRHWFLSDLPLDRPSYSEVEEDWDLLNKVFQEAKQDLVLRRAKLDEQEKALASWYEAHLIKLLS